MCIPSTHQYKTMLSHEDDEQCDVETVWRKCVVWRDMCKCGGTCVVWRDMCIVWRDMCSVEGHV